MKKPFLTGALLALAMPVLNSPVEARERWTAAQANTWYAEQKWLVGSNYIPADAINQLEMWQEASFDPAQIDKELGWAQGMGMNTMRVFLHDALWQQDGPGFNKRIEVFLAMAARHGIKPLLVLFDSCWDPDPKLGTQHAPVPGVHNSGWVQGPGARALADPSQYPRLEGYVKDVVGRFARDRRVLGWDVWNEPDNTNGSSYPDNSQARFDQVALLLPKVFDWARSADPSQPLTSGIWHHDHWEKLESLNAVEKTQLTQSDVISFHDYSWPETFEARARSLEAYGRPILCTEYMARGAGSTFDTVLPIGKRLNIGMINWGFVNGKTQTDMPWDSWQRPYTSRPPTLWFHDILHRDGTPYRAREVETIRELSAAASVDADEVTVVRDVLGAEGPLVVDGNLYYVAWTSGTLSRWDGKTSTVLNDVKGCSHNGLALTKRRTFLLACSDEKGSILELDLAGQQLRRWDADEKGHPFAGGINDVTVTASGGAYATVFGPFREMPADVVGKVLYLAPGRDKWVEVASGINYANGVGIAPDQKTLYVSAMVGNTILKFTVQDDGSLSHPKNFAVLSAVAPLQSANPWLGPDSLKVDARGNLYVAQWAGGRILKISPEGKLLHVFKVEAGLATTNVAFSADEKDLYVTVVKDPKDAEARGSIVRIPNVK